MIRNRIIYSILLLLVLIITIYTTDTIAYLILYSLILLPVVSLIFTIFKKKSVIIEESLSETVIEKGKETRLYINYSGNYRFHTHKGIEYSKNNEYISIKGITRGRYKVGIKSLGYADWLNLFRIYKKIESELTLEVIPKHIPIKWLPIDETYTQGNGLHNNAIEEDNTDVIGLTEYHHQISLRDIHWKATARKGELIAKAYNKPSAKEINLVVANVDSTYNEDFIDVVYSCLIYLNDYKIHYYYISIDEEQWKCVNNLSSRNIIDKIKPVKIIPAFNMPLKGAVLLLIPDDDFNISHANTIKFKNINEFRKIYGKD